MASKEALISVNPCAQGLLRERSKIAEPGATNHLKQAILALVQVAVWRDQFMLDGTL